MGDGSIRRATRILVSQEELSRCKEKGEGVCAKGLGDGCVNLIIIKGRIMLVVDRGSACAEKPWIVNRNSGAFILNIP